MEQLFINLYNYHHWFYCNFCHLYNHFFLFKPSQNSHHCNFWLNIKKNNIASTSLNQSNSLIFFILLLSLKNISKKRQISCQDDQEKNLFHISSWLAKSSSQVRMTWLYHLAMQFSLPLATTNWNVVAMEAELLWRRPTLHQLRGFASLTFGRVCQI